MSRLRRLIARSAGDRGSPPLAMLLTMVGIGLSGVLAANVNAQILAARESIHQSDAYDAAHTGVEVVLGMIRTATATGAPSSAGDTAKLPCGPFAGTVNPVTDQLWSATVYYLSSEPPQGDLPYAQANKLACATGATYGAALPKPLYVLISATGVGAPNTRGRVLNAVYPIRTTSRDDNQGGLIRVLPPSGPSLCLAAPGATPAAGSPLKTQTCDTGSDAQRFAWTSTMNVVLVSSRADGSTGMCLDAAPNQNEPVLFQACQSTPVARQQWGLNVSNWESTDGATLTRYCFHLTSPGVPGSGVVLYGVANDPPGVSEQDRACDGTVTDSRSFALDRAVGNGRVGAAGTGQVPSFEQHNRCLTLPAGNINSAFLAIPPCTQRASGAVAWYETWTLPAVPVTADRASGRVAARKSVDGNHYCLTSPGIANGYVRVYLCPGTIGPSMTWTRTLDTGVYGTSYVLQSTHNASVANPFCLSRTDPAGPDLHNGASKLTVTPCDGSDAQKWNASPMVQRGSTISLNED